MRRPQLPQEGSGLVAPAVRGIAWLLYLLVTCGVLVALWLILPPQHFDVEDLWPLSWLGFPMVGAWISYRRPGNTIGRILTGIGAAIPLSLVGSVVALEVYEAGRSPTFWETPLLWLGSWAFVPAFGLVPFLVLYFPDGRVRSARWARASRAAALVLAFLTIWYMFRPVAVEPSVPIPTNPLGVKALAPLVGSAVESALGLLLVAFALATLVHAVLRFRKASPETRQQLKAFVAALAIFPTLFVASLIFPDESPASTWLAVAAFLLGLNGIAAAIAVAVFRYRLYDIDRVISRTVTYTLVAGVLALVYVGGVFLVQQVIGAEGDVAVAGSTLAAFALFSPLRRRVQRWVDRKFNRSRYDAASVVEGLASKLRDRVELEVVTAELVGAARSALQPATVAVWVREER